MKPKASKEAVLQILWSSILDQLSLIHSDSAMGESNNPDLRYCLSNKRKFCSEEPVDISPSQCRQVGCQFVTVHSVQCCLGSIPIAYYYCISSCLPDRYSVFNRLSVKKSKRSRPLKKKTSKLSDDIYAASVNMASRGDDSRWSRRRR